MRIGFLLLASPLLLIACAGESVEFGEAPQAPQAPQAIPAREQLLEVNGTRLFVKRIGAGEPIVVVHGGPVLEHGYLLPHLEPLAREYELILYDQRICGRSDPEVPAETVRLAQFAEDIEALRVALELDRIHLMGHSFGGLLAMQYAVRHGEQLRSLILLDSMSASSTLWHREEELLRQRTSQEVVAEGQEIRATEAFQQRRPEAIRELLLLTFRAQFHDPAKIGGLDLFVPDDYPARSRQFGAMMPDLTEFDLHPELGRLEAPALILYGASEPGATIGGVALDAALPDSRLERIEQAGHFPFIEQQDATLAVIREFLATTG